MPRIASVATVTPPHTITQQNAKAFAQKIFNRGDQARHLMPVFDNSMVHKRHFVRELDWFGEKHDFTEVNDLYIKSALDLSERVIAQVAEQSDTHPSDIDAIFFVSTTGLSTPSIDARLFNRIALNPHIKRIPIWGLGCAGGAAGLARAHDYLKAYPTHRALVVAVELCGLAFQLNDTTKANIISTAIFGDGASACLLIGDEVRPPNTPHPQPSILASLSTIYPNSEDVMSWRITSEGFKVQLSKDIPSIINTLVKENVNEFLRLNEIPFKDVAHFILHPGGMKILYAYVDALGIPMEKLRNSVDVLQNFGNMSSTTVFFVLQRFLESTQAKSGEYGLLGSLGPGFSSELVLLKWD